MLNLKIYIKIMSRPAGIVKIALDNGQEELLSLHIHWKKTKRERERE